MVEFIDDVISLIDAHLEAMSKVQSSNIHIQQSQAALHDHLVDICNDTDHHSAAETAVILHIQELVDSNILDLDKYIQVTDQRIQFLHTIKEGAFENHRVQQIYRMPGLYLPDTLVQWTSFLYQKLYGADYNIDEGANYIKLFLSSFCYRVESEFDIRVNSPEWQRMDWKMTTTGNRLCGTIRLDDIVKCFMSVESDEDDRVLVELVIR